jgi:DNA-binding response OmpR family regulator
VSAAPLILLVEDDRIARRFLADNLVADGFEVLEAGSLATARDLLARELPALAIVDLGLPDGDGLELVRFVRRADRIAGCVDPGLPLIVLTGRGSEVERLRGFERGADDYVVKPFSLLELTARIRAQLRRRDRRAGARLQVGPLEVDTVTRQVRVGEASVSLSVKEFGLLRVLAGDPGRVFTRAELLQEVWGYQLVAPTRTLDSHIHRLRRKLGQGFIVNVWGVGYRLLDGGAA